MDGKGIFIAPQKKKKLDSVAKMERFEQILDNELSFHTKKSEVFNGNGRRDVDRLRTFNILREQDFEKKTWGFSDLLSEQKYLRKKDSSDSYEKKKEKIEKRKLEEHREQLTEEEQNELANKESEAGAVKFRGGTHDELNRMAYLAQRYTDISEKDRKKALKKYFDIVNEDVVALEREYKLKEPELTEKEKLNYEKKLIELNETARNKYIEAMSEGRADKELKQKKNKIRKYYRMIRMYFMHARNPEISEKQRRSYKSELKKYKEKLRRLTAQVWGQAIDDEDFDWTATIGAYGMEDAQDYAARQKRKKEYEDGQEVEDRKDYQKEVEREVEFLTANNDINMLLYDPKDKEQKTMLSTFHAGLKQRRFAKLTAPARLHFLRTGIWDPNAKALSPEEEARAPKKEEMVENWYVGESYDVAKRWLERAENLEISDEVFVGLVKKMNESFIKNKEEFTASVKKNGGFARRFFNDLDDHIEYCYERKKGETKEETQKRHEYKKNAKDLRERVKHLQDLHYPEVDALCEEIYSEMFKRDGMNFGIGISSYFSLQSYRYLAQENVLPKLQKLTSMGDRYTFLRDNLQLNRRGQGIWQSPAVRKLILSEEIHDETTRKALVSHANGMDKLIHNMVEKRYGVLAGREVYDEVIAFLGDKALFSDFRQVRDLTDRFMSALSLTSLKAARIDADFRMAYEDIFGNDYDPLFRDELERYIAACNTEDKEGTDRVRLYKKFMKPMKTLLDMYIKKMGTIELTKEGWDEAVKGMKNVLKYCARYTKDPYPVEKERDGKYIDEYLDSVQKKNGKKKGEKLSYRTFRDLDKGAEQKGNIREIAEYSYKDMLLGAELLESPDIQELFPDKKMREFLGEHLHEVIIENPEIKERYPFLKDMKSLDQLDELHYSQFEQLRNYLRDNLLNEEMKAYLSGVFEGETGEDEQIFNMKKNMLLSVFGRRCDVSEVSAIYKKQIDALQDKERLQRTRLYYKIGQKGAIRDGKIRIRFEDMPDRDKSILQSVFGKNSKDYGKRMDRFGFAADTWRRLEEAGPAAVKQMKKWIEYCFRETDDSKIEDKLKRLASMLKGENMNRLGYGIDDDILAEAGKNVSKDAFLEQIREAVTCKVKYGAVKNGKKVAKNEEIRLREAGDVSKFIRELSFMDSQDVLFSHGGTLQGGIFNFYGDQKHYNQWLIREAKKARKRTGELDKHLEKFADRPKLQQDLRGKLMPAYFETDVEVHESIVELEKKLKTAQIEYNTLEKNYLEIKPELEKLRKDVEDTKEKKKHDGHLIELYELYREKLSEREKELDAAMGKQMKAAEEKLKKAQEKQMEALQSFAQTMQTKANAKIEKSGKTAKKKGYQADDQSKLVNEKFNNDEKKQQKIAELAEKVQKAREEYDDLKNEYDFHMEAFRDFRAYVNENAEAYEEAVRTRQATEDACNEAEAALKKADEDSSLSNYEKKWLEKKEEMEAISAKITAKQRQLSSEYWKNLSLCGFDNLDQLDRCLGGAFDENGALKNEVKDTVDLLEDRRKLVESCGEGELTVFWDAFINNDSILTDLLSPDMKVAEGRVQQLHAMLAPLGKALTEEYPYIAKFFIEDKLVKLLDSKSPDTETKKIREELEKITKEMPEKLRKAEELYKKELDAAETPEDEQTAKVKYEKKTENIRKGSVNFWKEQLGAYRNDYLDKKKRGTSSIREKIQEGGAHIRQDLTKHLLYDDEDTKKQFKDRTAKYRKWWFRTSKNTGVELVAQKHKQTKYQIAFANANEIIMNMQDVIINDEAAMNSIVNNTRTTKDYFEKLRDRYLANDEKAEAAFLHYALNKVYKKNTEYEETAIEAAVKELDEEVQKELSDALILFKKHISKPAVQLDTKEFDAVIDRYAADFLTLHRSQQAEYKKNKTEEEKKYEAKRDKERKARAVVMNEKTRGKQLFREKLFGGMYDELGRIGDRKQSLVYTPEKGKQNKKVKSKGEATDKQWLDAARAEFELDDEEKKKKLTVYPDILAVCLDEYCRLHHSYADRYVRLGDKISNWFLSEDNKVETDIKHEARRLKLISRIATGQEEVKGKEMPRLPEKARDLFLVYAARFAPLSADDSTLPDSVIRLAEEFLPYYTEIEKLDAVEVKDPALRYALTDAKEKARAFLFNRDEKGLPSDVQKFTEMLENQRKYFAFADRAVAVLDDETLKNKKIGLLGDEGKRRYTDNIREYFLGRIMDDAMNGTAFDEASYRLAVQERLKGEEAREALVAKSDRISSAEYNYHEDYPGQLTERDLEFAIAATKKKALIKKYNALDWQERKIFALALYCTKDGESGTQKVVYGTDHRLYKEDRQQLLSYIKGENVDFKVDYTRAVRAVAAKSKRTKVSGDSEAFEAAIRYVEQINRRRFELQPKDYSRMADPAAMAKDADRVRAKLISDKADNLTNHNDAINGVKITDRKDFYKILSRMSGEDVKRKQSQGFFDKMPDKYRNFKENNGVQAVCERINKMTQGRRTLLMYILQDRTVLDYSTAGKNSDKIVPHVNEEKRFALMEKLMTEEGRLEALAEAESPEVAERALKSLLSFQLRDDKPLTEGKLTEDDFEPGSLKRVEAIDWMLLANAIDFLDELEQEQRRILAVRQAPLRVLNPTEEMKKKNKPVTDYMKGRSLPKNSEQFEEYLRGAVITDSKLDPGDTKIMDLFRGYMSLTPQEKVLFYRALNHRDVLDVSQRNLYRNFLGLDERDYVNDKERNLLVDEYIEKTTSGEGIDMGTTTYGEAMLSLLSTQINDDMNFEEVDGSNWAYKNLNVDNQLFVFDSRSKYVIDWKLFERGLQLVTRTVAERKASAGDKALYENLGDKMNGEFSMDRSFMRRNLHHTGARFMRFLAREGYSQIEDSLGIFDSAAGWAEFVVSTKTANFLHSKANAFAKKPAGEEEKEEEAKEEEAKDEDKQVEAKADAKEEKAVSFVRSLGSLVSSVKDQYDSIKEMKDKVRETYGEYRDLIVGEEEEEEEKLPENEEERKKFLEKKAEREKAEAELKEIRAQKPTDLDKEIGGIPLPPGKDVLGTVLALGEKLPGYKEMADKYLKDPEMLEKVDNYISRVFKDKISAKTLGEWYTAADEWVEDKKDTVFGFVADDHLPAEVKDTMDQLLNIAENTTEVLEKVAGYLTPAIGILGDIKNMWEARNNMKELDEKKAEAGELKKNDDDLIGGVDVTEKTRQILEEAREENALLLNTNNTDVKNIQKRNMLGSAANVVKGGLKLAGVNGADKAVDAVADFIKFIHKCMTDKDAVMNYYKSGGSGAVSKLLDGQMKMAEVFHTNNGIEVKSMDIDIVGTNNYSIGKNGLKELQHGLGFERQGELADHVRLCMVNALLFSASKFNPLKQPRLLAITALKVLGVEDAIGKTDAETAMRVFTKLKD